MEFYNRLEPFTPSEKKQPVKQLFDDYLLKNMMFSFEQLQDEFIALLADPNLKDKDRTLIETMINETNVLFLDTDHKDVAKHKDFCKQYHQILRETYNKLSDPLVGFRTVMAVALNLLVSITVVGLAVQVAQRKFFLFGKPQPKNKQVRKALKDTKRSVKKEETQEELPPTIAPK